MPLPSSFVENLEAPPRKLLVQRAEQPLVRGRIIIPAGIRSSTRASEATVVSVGAGIEDFKPGDALLLASSVGVGVSFGDRDEIKFALVDTFQVMARIEEPHGQTENASHERGPLEARDQPGRFVATDDSLRAIGRDLEQGGTRHGWDEGDPRGQR